MKVLDLSACCVKLVRKLLCLILVRICYAALIVEFPRLSFTAYPTVSNLFTEEPSETYFAHSQPEAPYDSGEAHRTATSIAESLPGLSGIRPPATASPGSPLLRASKHPEHAVVPAEAEAAVRSSLPRASLAGGPQLAC
jgi:hypothetical protein